MCWSDAYEFNTYCDTYFPNDKTEDDNRAKKAYAKHAKTYHPDKKGGSNQMFQTLQQCYPVDPEDSNKRITYSDLMERRGFVCNEEEE